jgi:hypothetical protein
MEAMPLELSEQEMVALAELLTEMVKRDRHPGLPCRSRNGDLTEQRGQEKPTIDEAADRPKRPTRG